MIKGPDLVGIYKCNNCANMVDTDRYIDDGQFYGEKQYQCSECGTYLLKSQLSNDDSAKLNWSYRNHISVTSLLVDLISMVALIVIILIVFFVFL